MTLTFTSPSAPGRFTVIGRDASEVPRSIQQVTAKTSDYAHAFVTSDGPGVVLVNPRPGVFPTTPGSSFNMNVAINAKDAAGNALPEVLVDVVLQGPPLPPNATHIEAGNPTISNVNPSLPDPGSDTISI